MTSQVIARSRVSGDPRGCEDDLLAVRLPASNGRAPRNRVGMAAPRNRVAMARPLMTRAEAQAATAAAHPFDADSKLTPVADNLFSATISDRWNGVGGKAFGGYGLAICLRALERDMRLHDPMVVSAFFLRALRPGPAEVRTEQVSAGRRVGFAEARLLKEGKEALRVIAAFTDLSRPASPVRMFSERPALPPPEECVDLGADSPAGRVPVADRVECRMPALPGWRRGRPTGDPSATFWMRFREPRNVRLVCACALGRRRPPGGVRARRDRLDHDRADRPSTGPAGPGMAQLPRADSSRDGRISRGGLRDMGRRGQAGRAISSACAPAVLNSHAPVQGRIAPIGRKRLKGKDYRCWPWTP